MKASSAQFITTFIQRRSLMHAPPSPFDPVQIGPITLRNRFIKSGANEGMCINGAPTKALVNAARLCREAGFNAVEIHMGHGYLLNQFISPLSNQRKDKYGGGAENRVRFPAKVLARVKEAVGKDLAVIAKINVADGVPGG